MALLWAYLGNDAARSACLLHPVRQLLRYDEHPSAWGLGYFEGGEVLLQRRPLDRSVPLDFYRIAGELRTDAVIGHSRDLGDMPIMRTPPYRYRSWLFAAAGELELSAEEHATLLGRLPDTLRRNVKGPLGTELLFHHTLRILGASRIDDYQLPPRELVGAIGAALRDVGHFIGGDRVEAAALALAFTNGQELIVVRQKLAVGYQAIAGIGDCVLCREKSSAVSSSVRRIEHEHLRGALVLAGETTPPMQHTLADRHALCVLPSLELRELPLFGK